MIEKNYDFETSEFKLYSFEVFQIYLTDKNPTHGRGTASVFQFSARRFLWRAKVDKNTFYHNYDTLNILTILSAIFMIL